MNRDHTLVTVNVSASMRPEELRDFLAVIRQWDGGRDEIRTVISADTGSMTADEVGRILKSIDPPIQIMCRSEKSHPDWDAATRLQGDIHRLAKIQ